MTYQEFIPTVKSSVESRLPREALCDVKKITKNNGHILNGLIISEDSTNIFPTIYLESYYEDFKGGSSIESISEKIIDSYESHRLKSHYDISFFKDYEKIKSNIVYRLVNRERNEALLKEIPWEPYLDLAICFYYILSIDDESSASILIKSEHCKEWGIKPGELFDESTKNTPRIFPKEIKPIGDFIGDFINIDMNECMLVVTNSLKTHGAGVILYPDVLKNAANIFESDFYILPSSIHEVMLLPAIDEYNKSELDKLVRQVNEGQLATEDILSDHAYYYSRNMDEIR